MNIGEAKEEVGTVGEQLVPAPDVISPAAKGSSGRGIGQK